MTFIETLLAGKPAKLITSNIHHSAGVGHRRVRGPVERQDIENLRARGFDSGEILEINQVASYFAYPNRTLAGLGVSTEGEKLGFSPEGSNNPDHWKHR